MKIIIGEKNIVVTLFSLIYLFIYILFSHDMNLTKNGNISNKPGHCFIGWYSEIKSDSNHFGLDFFCPFLIIQTFSNLKLHLFAFCAFQVH